ncbi:magnesium transporter [Bifidobacterium vespertilionis]|uniref:magnesium transporter n=1 Tax=Bifidobacterium vespertilionis TaxID=2562524 RepID=UPI001BDBCD6D|nr:magnesium transporter [Bifidobacterium vespertilionis]MBT1178470.1 magnesium transporter [Bifidobacterium vespertilionis]
MGYESLSSVVLVAIAALLVFVWAPRKARKGMKDASEHRADRFSASLHLVDAASATRFSDATPPIMKGLSMQAEQQRKVARLTPQRVAHIRQLRRAAIRRRQILVASLAAVAVVVLVLALVLKFSPLYALIPFALMCAVLALGVRASKQARAWEAELAAVRRTGQVVAQVLPQTVGKAARPVVPAQSAAPSRAAGPEPVRQEEPATDVLTASEIQDAVDRARAEQKVVKAERAGEAMAARPKAAEASQPAPSAQPARSEQPARSAEETVAPERSDSAQPAEPSAAETPAQAPAEADDATNELARISPSHALDAFEMASSQDLISFSLGASRAGKPVRMAEPESMEIKSTRQVAKAVPPLAGAQTRSADAKDDEAVVSFHDVEASGDVEAPAESSDSLGVDVDAVIARRMD